MNKSDLKLMINQYYDGELEKGKEPLLFTQLSQDEESREYFKHLNTFHNTLQDTVEEFPDYLEERILHSLETPDKKGWQDIFNKNLLSALSYSVAVVLIFVSLFFYFQTQSYKEKYDVKVEQVKQQNQTMELLFHSLPAAEVVTTPENQVVVTTKM